MEEEVRQILRDNLPPDPRRGRNLAEAIRARVAPVGGVNLALPARERVRRPPDFAKR